MSKDGTNKERIAWIDNVKLFAILCVILYHSSALVVNEYYYSGWIIETFNMALFFLLSGLSSYHSIVKIESFKGWLNFSKKKFVRIMVPCLFVSLLVFQKPCSFWFLLTLFYYLIAFASFHYICTFLKISPNWAFLFLGALLLIDVPKVGNDQEFVISFAVGLFFSKIRIIDLLSEVPKQILTLVVIGGFAIWLLLLPYYQSFYLNQFNTLLQNNTLYVFGIRQIIEVSFSVACCLLFMNKIDRQTKYSWVGGATLGMYIIHVTILTLIDADHLNWEIDAHGHLWGNFAEIAGFVILTIGSIFLVKLLEGWKWTNCLILGNPLDRADKKSYIKKYIV